MPIGPEATILAFVAAIATASLTFAMGLYAAMTRAHPASWWWTAAYGVLTLHFVFLHLRGGWQGIASDIPALATTGLWAILVLAGLQRFLLNRVPKSLIAGLLVALVIALVGSSLLGTGGGFRFGWPVMLLVAALFLASAAVVFRAHRRRFREGYVFLGVALLGLAIVDIAAGLIPAGADWRLSEIPWTLGFAMACGFALMVVAQRRQQIAIERAEAQLRRMEDRYQLAVKGSNVGVWDWNLETGALYLTPRLREICNYPPEPFEFTAETVLAYVHPDDRERYRAALCAHLKGETEQFKIEVRLAAPHEDGGVHWVENSGVCQFGPDGRAVRMAGTVHDATERKRQEAELYRAKEQAEFASRSKTDFLAHMSHELRTPLNSIIGFSDILKRQTFGPIGNAKYVDYSATIHMAGRHLLQLISDIIDVSRIEAGQARIEETDCDLTAIAESCRKLVGDRANDAGVRLVVDVDPDLPHLRGDEVRLKQIVINLLSNAIKFTPGRGKVTLRLAREGDGGIRLSVIDTGCGIARKDIPKALSRFGRLGTSYTRHQDGLGLGLSLVQMFTILHDGEFTLESEVEEGTVATVRFTASRVIATDTGTDAASGVGSGAPGNGTNGSPDDKAVSGTLDESDEKETTYSP